MVSSPPPRMMGREGAPSLRALAWDPTSTASLAICPTPKPPPSPSPPAASATTTTMSTDLDVFLSHDGTGCPTWEAECLLRCLDARGRLGAGGRRTQSRADATGGLSAACRSAVRDCLRRLEEEARISKSRRAGEGVVVVVGAAPAATADDDDDYDCGGDSLRLIHAVIHLAEIFLLPPSSSSGFRTPDFGGGFRDVATTGGRRLDGPAGSMTADAVRYLRLHHGRGYSVGSENNRVYIAERCYEGMGVV